MKKIEWISLFVLFFSCAGNLYINKYSVEIISGNSPILITVPHDGYFIPRRIPVRSDSIDCALFLKNDLNTKSLAVEISKNYFILTKQNPSLVFNNIHRKYVDMNRSKECSSEHPYMAKLYRKYVSNIKMEIKRLTEFNDNILHIDLHGHSSDSSDIIISTREHSTISMLYETFGEDLFYGDFGLVTLLENRGYTVKLNDPFTGGHTIHFVHELYPESVNSLQFEIHSRFRQDNDKLKIIAVDLVSVILQVESLLRGHLDRFNY